MTKINSTTNFLNCISCALGTNDDEHISKDPKIFLGCGHTVCNQCQLSSLSSIDSKILKCNICEQEENQEDSNKNQFSVKSRSDFYSFINDNLLDVFKIICERFNEKLEQYKNIVSDTEENLDREIQFVKEEIEIRFESLKMDLDVLNIQLNEKLDEIRLNWQNEVSKMKDKSINEEQLSKELKELKSNIKNQKNLTEESFYEYENKIREMNKIINGYKYNVPKLEFSPSKFEIKSESFGHISWKTRNLNRVIECIKNKKTDKISIPYIERILKFYILPNGKILLVLNEHKTLLVFESDHKYSKQYDSINGFSFMLSDIDFNDNDEIYFSDWQNSCVLKTDYEFKDRGCYRETDNIQEPCGICYNNGLIYVCSVSNLSIVVLDSDLNFQKKHSLLYTPWNIQIIDSIACVRSDNTANSIYFYNLDTFTEIKKYEGHNGIIGIYDSYFFEYCSYNKNLYCYDQSGIFKEKLTVNIDYNLGVSNFNGSLRKYHSKFVMCPGYGNSILLV